MESCVSAFTEYIERHNPPRLVVRFQLDPAGNEQFEWGVVGDIPVLSLIGHVSRVQAGLCGGEWLPEADGVAALVVTYDTAARSFRTFSARDIPAGPLAGMLEVIKSLLVGSRMAQHAGANRTRVLGL